MVKKTQINGWNIKPSSNQFTQNQKKIATILQQNMYEQKKIARIMHNIYIEDKLASILRNIYTQKKLLLTTLENRRQISFREKIYLELLRNKTKIDLANDVNYVKTLHPIKRELFFIKQYEEMYILRQKINRMKMAQKMPMYSQKMFNFAPMQMMRPFFRRGGDTISSKSSTRISK